MACIHLTLGRTDLHFKNGIRPCPLTYQWYHRRALSGSDTPIPIYPKLHTPTYPISGRGGGGGKQPGRRLSPSKSLPAVSTQFSVMPMISTDSVEIMAWNSSHLFRIERAFSNTIRSPPTGWRLQRMVTRFPKGMGQSRAHLALLHLDHLGRTSSSDWGPESDSQILQLEGCEASSRTDVWLQLHVSLVPVSASSSAVS